MKFAAALALLASTAQAHYVFPSVSYGGATTQQWEYVRRTANYQSNGPVTDVRSAAMTCYQAVPGNEGTKVMNVTAGSTITFNARASISHPGPLLAYMAKAPADTHITQWDGKGKVFFKIFDDRPNIAAGGMSWPSQGKAAVQFTIPKCIEDGQYFLRVEHIGLHSAGSVGGAQLYISCAQLHVTGGTGTYKPNLLAFPGAYDPTDKGLMINIYYPVPTSYTPPGGPVMSCAA